MQKGIVAVSVQAFGCAVFDHHARVDPNKTIGFVPIVLMLSQL
jgi:hypothetical protein